MSFTEKRLQSPTALNEKGNINGPERTARRKIQETSEVAMKIHGGTPSNMQPAYFGLFATLSNGASASTLTDMFYKSPTVMTKVIPNVVNEKVKAFENSKTNFVRSVNVLYRNGLVSKVKYISIRSALSMNNKENSNSKSHTEFMSNCNVPRILPYKEFMYKIKGIDIGNLYDLNEQFCTGLGNDDHVEGKYRDLTELLLRWAQFYLKVNEHRLDKLIWYNNKQAGHFNVAIGGDGAPFGKDDSALAWLVSFLNCGHRISSRNENFLLLGANCSEDCEAIRRYVLKLSQDIKEIEKKTYSVSVDGQLWNVSFSFDMFPNDMKYIAFLAGELSISATYFSPFANVKKADICDTKSTFGVEPSHKWKPWTYQARIKVASAVAKKKQELSHSSLKLTTLRNKVTTFIANKGSRTEFPPLLGEAIDRVKAEPLHLKNNAWQQWHALILKYAIARTNLSGCENVSDTPLSSCFNQYYEALKCVLKATRLAKKVRKWFCDGRLHNKDLSYRFTGKESKIMSNNFMKLINSLSLNDDQSTHIFKLHIFAIIAVNLRDAVSLFSRINITNEEVILLKKVSGKYFRACALFASVTPTTWTIGHVVPTHTHQAKQQLGYGLGMNSMEGREAKHVSLAKFARNTHHSTRWLQVFRHEYISLLWLRENGCDSAKYTTTRNKYIPARCYTAQFCHCGQPKVSEQPKCDFCSHSVHQIIYDSINQGKLTAEARKLGYCTL